MIIIAVYLIAYFLYLIPVVIIEIAVEFRLEIKIVTIKYYSEFFSILSILTFLINFFSYMKW